MKFHILTIFPDFFRGPLDHGVIKRACQSGLIDVQIHDLRDYTHDRHRTVDDRPFGGGEGMVMKCEPIFEAVEAILPGRRKGDPSRQVILLSAQGKRFDQAMARKLVTGPEELLLICGRYEGVDERVAQHLADCELSIGDYVLSGGELAAAVVLDAVARLEPGVLGNQSSALNESFSEPGVLDCPHYTRPEDFRGWRVPEVLLGGHHADIEEWRQRAARDKTRQQRPGEDLPKILGE